MQLAVLLAAITGCLYALSLVPWWGIPPLILAAGILSTSAAMLGHEGSHKSFSASPTRNAVLTYLTFPLFGGLSVAFWREKHDRLHHGHPNVDGKDTDVQPFPFVSSKDDHERCGPARRWFHRNLQRWAFWPMSTLMVVGIRRSSLIFMYAELRKRGVTRGWLLDAACLVAHYAGWLLVPSLIWGPLVAFGVYTGVWLVVGVALACIFAPAHIGLPILNDQHHDWQHQLETTRNLALPRAVSWFFVGLDYQVEHHLFPKITHQHLPRAAAITAAWCERHGLPYQRIPYTAAWIDAARFMADAWKRPTLTPDQVRPPARAAA